MISAGAMTMHRDDLQRGLEPDECFYVQSTGLIQPDAALDLSREPPPDLVVEIDVTSLSDSKLPIYASLSVTEVWHWRDGLHILSLESGLYSEQMESRVLPDFPIAADNRMLAERSGQDTTALLREFVRIVRTPH